MIDGIVRNFLGQSGSSLLDLYQVNSLLINGVLLVYALLVILGQRAYRTLVNRLVDELIQRNPATFKNKSQQSLENIIRRMELPLQPFLASIPFPFLTPPKGFLPYIKTRKNAARLITPAILAEQIHTLIRMQETAAETPENSGVPEQ